MHNSCVRIKKMQQKVDFINSKTVHRVIRSKTVWFQFLANGWLHLSNWDAAFILYDLRLFYMPLHFYRGWGSQNYMYISEYLCYVWSQVKVEEIKVYRFK